MARPFAALSCVVGLSGNLAIDLSTMYYRTIFVVIASLVAFPLVIAGPYAKATIAIHGASLDEPFTYDKHSLMERAPVSNVSPNITDRAWINGVLARVALWRERHKAVPLVWSTTLAQFALDAANKCKLAHTGGPYGENIYWISSSSIDHYKQMKQGIDAWGNEYMLYDANNPHKSDALHFTALVWKSARKIGCAWTNTTCANTLGGFLLFCELDPVVNVVGQFPQNVTP